MKRSGTFMPGLGGLGCHLHAGYRVPDHQAFLKHRTLLFCAKALTTATNVLSDASVGSQKALGLACRFEAPHWWFALTGRVVAVFRSIVQTFVLTLLHATQQLLFGRSIAAELIADQHPSDILTALEQLAKEGLGSWFVASALHQDIEQLAWLINCAPQLVQLGSDGKKKLIQMPVVARLCTTSTQLLRILLAKLLTALADRLVGHDGPTLYHQLFDIAIAEREAIGEPDRLRDDLGRKSTALRGGRR